MTRRCSSAADSCAPLGDAQSGRQVTYFAINGRRTVDQDGNVLDILV